MGRELKRVALDFQWPLEKPWKGYVNPHYQKCTACDGAGDTVARRRLEDLVHLLMLSGEDAGRGKCHPWLISGELLNTYGCVCGPDMAELTGALAERAPDRSLGHDACDRFRAVNKIIQAAGLAPKVWGICPECDGKGIPNAVYAAYEAWEQTEPPEGPGYQIWETVTEGSPISPVFATPEELAHYMAGRAWGADKGSSYETWLSFITGPGYAPSMVITAGGEVKSGPAAGLTT